MTSVTGSQSVRGTDMNCCGIAQHCCDPQYSADYTASFPFGIPKIFIYLFFSSFLTISNVMCIICGINPKGFNWINKESLQNQKRSYWINLISHFSRLFFKNFSLSQRIMFDSSLILLGFFRFQWKSCASCPGLCLECNTSSLNLL